MEAMNLSRDRLSSRLPQFSASSGGWSMLLCLPSEVEGGEEMAGSNAWVKVILSRLHTEQGSSNQHAF